MLQWVADPERGNMLPAGFRNPFAQGTRSGRRVAHDPLCSPEISTSMAADLVRACDRFQLAMFAPLLLYGLRPSELGWLLREYVDDQWLRVPCNLDLDYLTKGRRHKAFPLVDGLRGLWQTPGRPAEGLLYLQRRVAEGRLRPPLARQSLAGLVQEFRRRCAAAGQLSAETRRRLRGQLMKEAGQLNYDHIQAEFQHLTQQLGWPAAATLKDLRHLFASTLEDAGLPEFFRRYLMGHPIWFGARLRGDDLAVTPPGRFWTTWRAHEKRPCGSRMIRLPRGHVAGPRAIQGNGSHFIAKPFPASSTWHL